MCFCNSRFFNYLVTFPTPAVGLFLYWLVDPGSLAKKSWTFNTAIYTLAWQKNSLRYWSNTQQIRLFQILVRIGGVRINWSAITMSEDQVHHTQSCWFDVNDEYFRTKCFFLDLDSVGPPGRCTEESWERRGSGRRRRKKGKYMIHKTLSKHVWNREKLSSAMHNIYFWHWNDKTKLRWRSMKKH